MEYTLAYGVRRQSAAATALWLLAPLSAQAKAVSRSACHRTPNIPRLSLLWTIPRTPQQVSNGTDAENRGYAPSWRPRLRPSEFGLLSGFGPRTLDFGSSRLTFHVSRFSPPIRPSAHFRASAGVENSSSSCFSRISASKAPIAGPGFIPRLIRSAPLRSGGRIRGCCSNSRACWRRKS